MRIFGRLLSPSVFTLVALCFLLPFATVTYVSGCGDYVGGTTSFTGIQLVTHAVPPATGEINAHEGEATSRDVERRGALAAEIAFGAAILGFLLGLLGIAAGPGWCAAVGLTALLQVYFSLSHGDWNEGFEWKSHPAFGLALLLFAGAGSLHLSRWWDRRGLSRSRRGYWIGVVAGVLGLSLVLFFALFAFPIALAIGVVSLGVAGYLYLRRRKARSRLGVVRGASYWEHVVAGAFLTYVSLAVGIWAHALWVAPLLWAGGFYVVRLVKTGNRLPAIDP